MKKSFFILLLLVANFVFSQGGYSPISRLRLTTTPVESNSNTQILVRDGSSGNVNYVRKDSLVVVPNLDKVTDAGAVTANSLSVGGVGINTTTPEAVLDVVSTESGILIPRLTESERDAISDPINSMLIFNSDSEIFEYYFDGDWFGVGLEPPQDLQSVLDEGKEATFFEDDGVVEKTLNLNLGNDFECRSEMVLEVDSGAQQTTLFAQDANSLQLYSKGVDLVLGEFSNETTVRSSNGVVDIVQIRTNLSNNFNIYRSIVLDYEGEDDLSTLTSNIATLYKPIPKYVDGTYYLTTTDDYGKLISRTTTQLLAIVDPEVGRLYYNTTINEVVFYNGTGWKKLSHSNM